MSYKNTESAEKGLFEDNSFLRFLCEIYFRAFLCVYASVASVRCWLT